VSLIADGSSLAEEISKLTQRNRITTMELAVLRAIAQILSAMPGIDVRWAQYLASQPLTEPGCEPNPLAQRLPRVSLLADPVGKWPNAISQRTFWRPHQTQLIVDGVLHGRLLSPMGDY